MKAEYAASPTYGAIDAATIGGSTAATATPVITVQGVTRYVSGSYTGNAGVVLTLQYPGQAAVDWHELAGTTTSIQINLTFGASDIRFPPGTIIGARRAAGAITGRLALTSI